MTMKKIYLTVLIVFTVLSNAYAYNFQEGEKNWDKWVACTSDEECIPIHDECGGWTAVNKKFESQGEEYQGELAATAKCSDVKIQPAPKILCLEQACSIKPSHLGNGI